ncbi:hypothetical protein IFM89_022846 [Coptis chinensis]|uniref:KIB1-4 beta-propeller domain-containing protein n=1 Tax=Coptis chinensis TaxID=261450 RepID=A0A835MFQ3_9MAGN|nr:hypothetical protein IFM89_022846 [Coptis chinensis]
MSLNSFSGLHEDILRLIAEKIDLIVDFIRFGAVCKSWRSVTLDKRHFSLFLKPLPWLMLTADDGEEIRSFFSPFENKIYRLNLPKASECHCWGSPFGWVVTVAFDHKVHMLNPLSRASLPLPPLSAFNDRYFDAKSPGKNRMSYITKAVVVEVSSSSIAEEQFLVLIIYGGCNSLAFARPGDETWTPMLCHTKAVFDALYFNGQFYAVNSWGFVHLCDTYGLPRSQSTIFARPPPNVKGVDRFYILELQGELHLVVRVLDFGTDMPAIEFQHLLKTKLIEVYKCDFCTRKWEKLQNLGDHAIFIGSNNSVSLKASDYPGCKPSCIYFTDDHNEASGRLVGHDMGIFNMDTGEIERLYEGDDSLSRYSPPVWITPHLL